MDKSNELKYIIHRNFSTVRDIGEVRSARGWRNQGPDAESGAQALVDMPPERLKVYLEEYAEELTFSPAEAGSAIEARGSGNAERLVRFIATLPLAGESADAARGMAKALSQLSDIEAAPLPDTLSIGSGGASLTLEVHTHGMSQSDVLRRLREAVTPLGFAVTPVQ